MIFIDYTNTVLLDYENKRKLNKLSSRLSNPSPAELRDECEAVFKNRYDVKDAGVLKTFFGIFNDEDSALQLIRNHPIAKFKPLVRFLNRKIKEPKQRNLDLIAWLIDFQPRPYGSQGACPLIDEIIIPPSAPPKIIDGEEENGTEDTIDGNGSDGGEVVPQNQPGDDQTKNVSANPAPVNPVIKKHDWGFKKTGMVLATALLTTAGIWMCQGKDSKDEGGVFGSTFSKAGQCMYWVGDHYEQVPCNRKVAGASVIALDVAKMEHFKKITRPDTLTEIDIGRVWYIKIDGGIEFYTADGPHPLRPDRDLYRLSKHIFDKHILPLKSPEALTIPSN